MKIPDSSNINIAIRKRPILQKEIARKDWDSITCLHPLTLVHQCSTKVDGISKYLAVRFLFIFLFHFFFIFYNVSAIFSIKIIRHYILKTSQYLLRIFRHFSEMWWRWVVFNNTIFSIKIIQHYIPNTPQKSIENNRFYFFEFLIFSFSNFFLETLFSY
jgi:hypothetical protein